MADRVQYDDEEFQQWLRRHRAENIESELLGVAEAGMGFLDESQRQDPAHRARLSKQREALEAAIASYNRAVSERKMPVSEMEPGDLARLGKLEGFR